MILALHTITAGALLALTHRSIRTLSRTAAAILFFLPLCFTGPALFTANGPGTLAIARRHYGYDIDAHVENDGWIVIADAAWKGWRGFVDGREVPLDQANGSFLAVRVARGQHHVKVIYRPRSFVIGRAVTIAALLAIAIVTIAAASVHHHRLRLE